MNNSIKVYTVVEKDLTDVITSVFNFSSLSDAMEYAGKLVQAWDANAVEHFGMMWRDSDSELFEIEVFTTELQ